MTVELIGLGPHWCDMCQGHEGVHPASAYIVDRLIRDSIDRSVKLVSVLTNLLTERREP